MPSIEKVNRLFGTGATELLEGGPRLIADRGYGLGVAAREIELVRNVCKACGVAEPTSHLFDMLEDGGVFQRLLVRTPSADNGVNWSLVEKALVHLPNPKCSLSYVVLYRHAWWSGCLQRVELGPAHYGCKHGE